MIIYAICLVLGLLFTVISAIAGHLFGGHDGAEVGTGGHAEAGFDHSGIPGISIFSPTVLASFVTAFGAFGLLFTEIPAVASWIFETTSVERSCAGDREPTTSPFDVTKLTNSAFAGVPIMNVLRTR